MKDRIITGNLIEEDMGLDNSLRPKEWKITSGRRKSKKR